MTEDSQTVGSAFANRLEFWLPIVLAPVWVPLWAISTLWLHGRLFWYLRGDERVAWQRCAKCWQAADYVYTDLVGPNLDTRFEHSLSVYFARYQPASARFLRKQLSHRNPHLAAYAFKCLIRHANIRLKDIPRQVLRREDKIRTLHYCFGNQETLGAWIAKYFAIQAELENQTSPAMGK